MVGKEVSNKTSKEAIQLHKEGEKDVLMATDIAAKGNESITRKVIATQ